MFWFRTVTTQYSFFVSCTTTHVTFRKCLVFAPTTMNWNERTDFYHSYQLLRLEKALCYDYYTWTWVFIAFSFYLCHGVITEYLLRVTLITRTWKTVIKWFGIVAVLAFGLYPSTTCCVTFSKSVFPPPTIDFIFRNEMVM